MDTVVDLINVKPIKVTRTFIYNPQAYIEYCEENEETPTQQGFLSYIVDWIYDDFDTGIVDIDDVDIEVLE